MSFVKAIARRAVVQLFRPEPVRQLAMRVIYLSKFRLWCQAHPCRNFSNDRDKYYAAVHETLPSQGIDYLEFGVYRGGSMKWWLDAVRDSSARFFGFDTFTGLPEDWTASMPKGTFSTAGRLPDITDPRCEFLVGLFQETLPHFLTRLSPGRPKVIHLDADLYSSTLFVLMALAPHLAPGDTLMFDEFQDYMDEFRALEQFSTVWNPKFEVLAQNSGYTQVAMRLFEPLTSK